MAAESRARFRERRRRRKAPAKVAAQIVGEPFRHRHRCRHRDRRGHIDTVPRPAPKLKSPACAAAVAARSAPSPRQASLIFMTSNPCHATRPTCADPLSRPTSVAVAASRPGAIRSTPVLPLAADAFTICRYARGTTNPDEERPGASTGPPLLTHPMGAAPLRHRALLVWRRQKRPGAFAAAADHPRAT